MTFGEFFKTKRIESGATLRKFCGEHEFDPGNISKLERGVLAPPQDVSKLEYYAKALGLKRGSNDYETLFDLATMETKTFKMRNVSNKDVLAKLPALFRTLDNKTLTEEKLNKIMEFIRS